MVSIIPYYYQVFVRLADKHENKNQFVIEVSIAELFFSEQLLVRLFVDHFGFYSN